MNLFDKNEIFLEPGKELYTESSNFVTELSKSSICRCKKIVYLAQTKIMDYPDYYLPIMPYLILKDPADFVEFTKNVFDADIRMLVNSEDAERKIVHGELTIGRAAIMFGGASDQWHEKTAGMFLFVDDVDKSMDKAVRHNAKILEPATVKDYGYSGGFEDPFGNQWWITRVTE